MKLLITYTRGARLILDFTTEQFAQDYLKAQARNIKCWEVL